MTGSIVPRPIAFVSTISSDGDLNLAPFSYFAAICAEPPTLCFAPGRRSSDGERKDTLINIEATGEFVVNTVTEGLGRAMVATAAEYSAQRNEFEVARLTPVPSHIVKPPRVKESPITMECKLHQVIPIGSGGVGGGDLVIGEIVMFHIADELYDEGRINIHKLKPLGRLAGAEYTTLGKIVSLQVDVQHPDNG